MLLKLTVLAFVPEDEGGWEMRKGVDRNSRICTEYICTSMFTNVVQNTLGIVDE